MTLKGKRIGFALTGSHCTYEEIFPQIEKILSLGASVCPIVSYSVAETDTRFGRGQDIVDRLRKLTGEEPIKTIVDAEPLGPRNDLDCIVIAPCTGNTLAKLASSITDTPVLMATKAHLRNKKPVLIAISTNDGLSMNARNLGILLNAKNVFFVPFGQDNPEMKANSLVADMEMIIPALEKALEYQQIQPVLIERGRRDIR